MLFISTNYNCFNKLFHIFDLISFQRELELNNKTIINAAENFKPLFNDFGKRLIIKEFFLEKHGETWMNSKKVRNLLNKSELILEISEDIPEFITEVRIHINLGVKMRRTYSTYCVKQFDDWECLQYKLLKLS